MLAHEMLVHQVIINALKPWVNAAGNPRHTCHFLHDDRIMDGVVGIFSLGERAVLIHHNPRRMQRLAFSQRVDNHLSGVEFVLSFHFILR